MTEPDKTLTERLAQMMQNGSEHHSTFANAFERAT